MPNSKKGQKKMNGPKLNYMVTASHVGLNRSLDAKIERKAARRPLGTGFWPPECRREVDFGFARKDAAKQAAARIRTLRNVRAEVRAVGND